MYEPERAGNKATGKGATAKERAPETEGHSTNSKGGPQAVAAAGGGESRSPQLSERACRSSRTGGCAAAAPATPAPALVVFRGEGREEGEGGGEMEVKPTQWEVEEVVAQRLCGV
jgi:hypothetical protein